MLSFQANKTEDSACFHIHLYSGIINLLRRQEKIIVHGPQTLCSRVICSCSDVNQVQQKHNCLSGIDCNRQPVAWLIEFCQGTSDFNVFSGSPWQQGDRSQSGNLCIRSGYWSQGFNPFHLSNLWKPRAATRPPHYIIHICVSIDSMLLFVRLCMSLCGWTHTIGHVWKKKKNTHTVRIVMSSAECFGHQINPLSRLECKGAKQALGMFTQLWNIPGSHFYNLWTFPWLCAT